MRWDIFCHIVDNYGDAGICWRLARSLTSLHQQEVRIFCDDLPTLNLLASGVDQSIRDKIDLQPWEASEHIPRDFPQAPDVVIEAFGCTLPERYLTSLIIAPKKPLIINLEYLSAEPWVVDFHGKASPQAHGIPKYFFFPGFQENTGGLLLDPVPAVSTQTGELIPQSVQSTWQQLRPNTKRISLFCYPGAPLAKWLQDLGGTGQNVDVILTYGLREQLNLTLRDPALIPPQIQLVSMPFVSQDDYDWVLGQCDFNIVRGEDSFLRAQLAGKPFIWHIYPQADQAHEVKLQAFLDLYLALADDNLQTSCNQAMSWAMPSEWIGGLDSWTEHAKTWRTQLLGSQADGGLAARLMAFVA
ncbi:conserved hypothetical protein, PP_1857 family [Polynucleobacter meluiroseus]|uniref:Protein-arginine rhamnosyltransferase n=1 Tax=Polynucleobacter meluiroseus TaxID=1938814 RepID=A0A240E126_9BURK|nr:elongation factor P maturation arginine rhamnosyltransferase EarP [Polynucleobacter meluiroseus]SNX28211.1 conserved hypothetical protein, PP_1857 family [Polynucleobacter meluiroseus]